MAVIAAFPLSLVVILSSVSFSIDIDILDFFPNCSYTAFALSSRRTSDMSRTESSSAASQDYLDFCYLFSAITFFGSGLGPQCKNGPRPQIIGPHKNIVIREKNESLIIYLKSSIFRNIYIEEVLYMGLIGDSTISVGTIDIFYYLRIETLGFKIFLIKKKKKELNLKL